MRQDGEASVEEILESIKKVIARDNRATAQETRRRRETEGVVDRTPEAIPEPADAEEAEEVAFEQSHVRHVPTSLRVESADSD